VLILRTASHGKFLFRESAHRIRSCDDYSGTHAQHVDSDGEVPMSERTAYQHPILPPFSCSKWMEVSLAWVVAFTTLAIFFVAA